MAYDVICIADEARQRFAIIGTPGGKLTRLDSTPVFAEAVDREIARLSSAGIRARVETVGDGRIEVDFRPVSVGDPRYSEAAAEFFRGLGYTARLLGEPQARVWLALRTLPVDEGLRKAWLPVLGAIPDDEAREMLVELDVARTELETARQAAQARGAAINAKAAGYKKEIEDKFREVLEKK